MIKYKQKYFRDMQLKYTDMQTTLWYNPADKNSNITQFQWVY